MFFNRKALDKAELAEVKKQELGLENLINKYRFFVLTFLIITDYLLMYFLNRMDYFNWVEELLGLALLYSLLFYLHKRTKGSVKRPWLKYFTVFLDYLIVLGCFHEGRDIILTETNLTIEQYLLLIFSLIILTNILSVFRLQLRIIILSTVLALLLNYLLLNEYQILPIVMLYTSMVIVLSGFFSSYVSTFISKFFITNYKLNQTLISLESANEEIREQNFELEIQNENLAEQRDQIYKQKKQITNSITYASRIQTAVLDTPKEIDEVAPNSFVLFKPKDIVSGDFYWFKNVIVGEKKYHIITAVDCTGHGVPGAFMSMLGTSFLNDIISEFHKEPTAAYILNRLRDEVKNHLRQNSGNELVKDGMDMALCAIDYSEMVLQFSGAHNPLYIIRNKKDKLGAELEEYKPDKMPIGVYVKEEESFTNNIIKIKKGDRIYLFSDGYIDQFGGEKGEKFKRNRFKELLLSTAKFCMDDQKEILEKTLQEWQGKEYQQIDDIIVIGVQV